MTKPDACFVALVAAACHSAVSFAQKKADFCDLLRRGQIPPRELLSVETEETLVYEEVKYTFRAFQSGGGPDYVAGERIGSGAAGDAAARRGVSSASERYVARGVSARDEDGNSVNVGRCVVFVRTGSGTPLHCGRKVGKIGAVSCEGGRSRNAWRCVRGDGGHEDVPPSPDTGKWRRHQSHKGARIRCAGRRGRGIPPAR